MDFKGFSRLESTKGSDDQKMKAMFIAFNEAWMKYWESYVRLQDRL